jgi:hypothetical protein
MSVRIAYAIDKTPKYKKYGDALPLFKKALVEELKKNASEIAYLIRDKAYKLASDQESMSFFQKIAADYFRYSFEAVRFELTSIEDQRRIKKK